MATHQNSPDLFTPSRRLKMKAAAHELRFLLSRNYPRKSSVEFVGNHHQLTKDERNILFRGVFSANEARAIRRTRVALKELQGQDLFIDGYNVTITLENAIRSRPLIKGNDGFIRDISGIFRGFRQSNLTQEAWRIIVELLRHYRPKRVLVFLDRPYSKSGMLAQSIDRWFNQGGVAGEAILSNRVDHHLKRASGIRATSDSSILIHGGPSIDLAGHIATRRLNRKVFVVP